MGEDWRKSAYLNVENWPEAIPPMGPKREYGPHPWGQKSHDDPHDLDDYRHGHPDAASIGESYWGDVCPYCGVPLRRSEKVVLISGRKGVFWEINAVDEPAPAYHPECWTKRTREDPDKPTIEDFMS